MKTKLLSSALLLFSILASTVYLTAQETSTKRANTKRAVSGRLIADLKFLSSDSLKGRETGTAENKKAREYIAKRFEESGLTPYAVEGKFFQPFSFTTRSDKRYEGVNIVGFIKGKTKAGGYIVITAHYDHLGVRSGKIYNGADDNASGTAALFALANYFKSNQPEHNLIFAAFDAEEKGHQGSRHFVSEPPVPLSDIRININLDMISRSDKNELYIAGTYHYPDLKPLFLPVVKNAPVKLMFGHDSPELRSNDWTPQSDHAQFHKKKIPFIYFGVEDHEDYHKSTDDFEKVNLRFYQDAVDTILMGVIAVDKNLKSGK